MHISRTHFPEVFHELVSRVHDTTYLDSDVRKSDTGRNSETDGKLYDESVHVVRIRKGHGARKGSPLEKSKRNRELSFSDRALMKLQKRIVWRILIYQIKLRTFPFYFLTQLYSILQSTDVQGVLQNLGDKASRYLPENTVLEFLLSVRSPVLKTVEENLLMYSDTSPSEFWDGNRILQINSMTFQFSILP